MRIPLLLTLLFSALACARPDYAEAGPGRVSLSAGPQPGYGIKRVVERQAPETLIADDGSICRTSPERFSGTHAGALIACVWNLPALD